MKSIRHRLVLKLLAGIGIIYTSFAALFYFHTREAFVDQFDEALAEKIATFADLTEVVSGRGVMFRFEQLSLPEFQTSSKPYYYQVWQGRESLSRSPSLGGRELERLAASAGYPRFHDVTLPDGRAGRAAALQFTARAADRRPPNDYDSTNPAYQLTIVMARGREELQSAETILFRGFIVFGLLLPLSTAAFVWRAVRKEFRPLDEMAKDLAEIQSTDLATRLAIEDLPPELRPVATRLNQLLDRLELAFARERRLTTDIAHELRTPIAELRLIAELASSHYADHPLPDPSPLKEVLDIARQMESQVVSLLALARCDARSQSVVWERFDIIALLEESWRPHQSEAERKRLRVELAHPTSAEVRSDRRLLSTILSNLIENAVSYTPDGGTVRCQLSSEGDYILRIANTNDQLREDELPHLFEPFWRKQASRSDSRHAGLGLALVKSYAELLGLTIEATLPEGGLFVMTLTGLTSEDAPQHDQEERARVV